MSQIETTYLFYDFHLLVSQQWHFGQFISYYTRLLYKSDIAAVTKLRKQYNFYQFF